MIVHTLSKTSARFVEANIMTPSLVAIPKKTWMKYIANHNKNKFTQRQKAQKYVSRILQKNSQEFHMNL